MRNLIVLHATPDHLVSGPIKFLSKMFNDKHYRRILLEKYNLKVTTSFDIQSDHKKTNGEFMKCDVRRPEFFDSVILNIHLVECNLMNSELKLNGIKFVGWQDDLHALALYVKDRKDKNLPLIKYCEKYSSPIADNLDYIISPSSVYFKNLGMLDYYHKTVDIFYFMNPNWFEELTKKSYKERKDEIILSGVVCNGYTSRIDFNKLKSKSDKFKNLIYNLPHPGYNTAIYKSVHPDHIDNSHMTEMNYYNKLSEFKGAFVGHYNFPLNFCLAKHIEVLMCGCLGFYEPNPLLGTQIGLKEFEHYIPCYKDGKIIEDYNFYKNWLDSSEGEKIAARGQAFVMENFGNKQIEKFFAFLQTC